MCGGRRAVKAWGRGRREARGGTCVYLRSPPPRSPRGRAAGRGRAQEVARATGGGRPGAGRETPVRAARATPARAWNAGEDAGPPLRARAAPLQTFHQHRRLNRRRNLVSWRLRILSPGRWLQGAGVKATVMPQMGRGGKSARSPPSLAALRSRSSSHIHTQKPAQNIHCLGQTRMFQANDRKSQ